MPHASSDWQSLDLDCAARSRRMRRRRLLRQPVRWGILRLLRAVLELRRMHAHRRLRLVHVRQWAGHLSQWAGVVSGAAVQLELGTEGVRHQARRGHCSRRGSRRVERRRGNIVVSLARQCRHVQRIRRGRFRMSAEHGGRSVLFVAIHANVLRHVHARWGAQLHRVARDGAAERGLQLLPVRAVIIIKTS